MSDDRLEQIRHTLMVAQPLLDKIGDGTPNEDDPDDFDLSSDVLLYGMIHDLLEYVDFLENIIGTQKFIFKKEGGLTPCGE